MLQKLLLLKVFLTKVIKTQSSFIFVIVSLIVFMSQTLTDEFWGLHQNKNCTFPLKSLKLFAFVSHKAEKKCVLFIFDLSFIFHRKIYRFCVFSK